MNKELIKALRDITKKGQTFNFGFSPVPKGIDYDIDKGLSDEMESELRDWITDELAPLSDYHSTYYELTFIDETISLGCCASWGGWLYEDSHSRNDILTDEVLKILLPDFDIDNIDIDYLSISFECTIDESKIDFNWWNDFASYEDSKGDITNITLKPLQKKLEKVFSKFLPDFGSQGDIDYDGVSSKFITVEDSHPTVEESLFFKLTFEIEND